MNRPELKEDPRYLNVKDRVERHAEIKALIDEWMAPKKVSDVLETLADAGIPCAPIYDIRQVVEDPHIAGAREMFVEMEHPVAGPVKLTGSHIKLSATPPSLRAPSPSLGQHNEDVYGQYLGFSAQDIAALKQEGVL